MDKIDTQHGCYPQLAEQRKVFHAVNGGTDAIRKDGKAFLPKYPAEPDADYDARLHQATLDGLVSSGCDTLSGAVFYGDIDTSGVNPPIVPLLENIDLKGTHFNVFCRKAFDAAFDGSAVILVDMPKESPESQSIKATYGAEADTILKRRPYWRPYFANDVINWRYGVDPLTHETRLELIVFHEPVDEVDPDNKYAVKTVDYYRVYWLENGVQWALWKKINKEIDGSDFVHVDGGMLQGRSAIPVSIVGCLEDAPRLLVESRLEVKAYQKESSFDVQEYMHIAMLVIKGRTGEAAGTAIPIGANSFLDVPETGDAFYLQTDSAGHADMKATIIGIKDTIKAKVNELVSSAMNSEGDKTATQANIEDRDKQARLIVWAEQFKDAIELALAFTAEAMGLGFDKGGEIVLKTKWSVAEEKAQEQQDFDRTIITEETNAKAANVRG